LLKFFDRKFILNSLLITAVNYAGLYFLSSREVLVDFKNIAFIVIFTCVWGLFLRVFAVKERALFGIWALSEILGLLIPYIGYRTEAFFLQRLMKDFLFWYTLPLPFFCLALFVKRKSLAFCFSFYTLLSLLSLVGAALGYYLSFGVKISADSILAVMQTNLQEGKEFLLTYFSMTDALLLLCFFLAFPLLMGRLFMVATADSRVGLKRYRFAVLVFSVLLLFTNIMFCSKTYLVRSAEMAYHLDKNMKNFDKEKEQRLQRLAIEGDTKSSMEENFALIIGETHTRTHMSAYGYERDTTPWLKQKLKDGNIVLADKAYAGAAVTHTSLGLALTERSQYNGVNSKDAVTLVEAAREAGYRVVWISNQLNDTIAGMIAMEADAVYWLNESKNDTYLRQKNKAFDNAILDKLKIIKNKGGGNNKTLYVIHLLGSHASYNCRYPDEFNKWNDENGLLNAYDNSILYNDRIMRKLSEELINELKVSMLMYFSDHGEELERKFCHGTEFFNDNYKKYASVRDVVRIPLYFIYSHDYYAKYPKIIHGLEGNSHKYFTNDMVYDTMLGVMGIRGSHYNQYQDFSSRQYNLTLDRLRTSNGKIALSDVL
jgi:heptose-I-phosphate ethanolaminephosphotransferase